MNAGLEEDSSTYLEFSMNMNEVISTLVESNPLMSDGNPARHGVWQLQPGGITVHLSMPRTGCLELSWFALAEFPIPDEFPIDQAELFRCATSSSNWYMDEFVE